AEAIHANQLAQLRTLLAHCLANVPYYRRTLQAAGLKPETVQSLVDLQRIPILPRRVYQQESKDIRTTVLPKGMAITGEACSTGTSGEPVRLLQTNVVQLWWLAFYLRDLEWCGMDP